MTIKTHLSRPLSMAFAGLSLAIVSAFAPSVYAEPPAADGASNERCRHDRPHGPPPEALDACKDKQSGDACQFNSPRGDSMSGVCYAPQDKPLACKPERPPMSEQQSPKR
ncbi:MAG: hypothetical protein AB1717_00615 [Pseudomonadota bacterium]